MIENSQATDFPNHVDQAVRSVAQLNAEHQARATQPQRWVNKTAALMARPWFIALMGLGVGAWIAANTVLSRLGLHAIDAPAFPWLQAAANLFSIFVVMLVLVAQKHADELNAHRDTLTLELAILSEHKLAKVIELLEELRRDSPQIPDRVDRQAKQMAEPADAGSFLAAVRESDEP